MSQMEPCRYIVTTLAAVVLFSDEEWSDCGDIFYGGVLEDYKFEITNHHA